MKLRPFGRSELQVSPLCFGGNVFGWTADEVTSFALLDDLSRRAAISSIARTSTRAGYRGTRVANRKGRRPLAESAASATVSIATKVGMDMPGLGTGLTPAQIERGAEDSLRRLQTDYIDLYYAHRMTRPRRCPRARGFRPAGQGRQGARDRRVELQCATSRGRSR